MKRKSFIWALSLENLSFGFMIQSAQLQSKKKGKDQESIQSSTTLDPGYQWESDNFSIRHHK